MIAITGGGTGGHLAIARAFCAHLRENGVDSIFIGSQNGQDKFWFENDENFKQKYFLPSSGVVNKSGFKKIYSLINIFNLSAKCKEIFKQNSVKAVISVGGYSAAPASFAAILNKIPLFIHEQNAINGKLNSILKPFCAKFYSSYQTNAFTYPVDLRFFNTKRERTELKTILFLGGSQGAKAINSLALSLALILKEKNIKIIHQCGKQQFEEIKKRYIELGFGCENLELFDFSKKLEEKMQEADLAITRAGASSLWELCANNLPCIFIPFPYAAANHQYYNAKFLLDLNLAKIALQKGDEIDKFEILNLIESYDIKSISSGLKNAIKEENKNEIVRDILNTLN